MTFLVPYFQVHQPWRLRRYTFFDIAARHDYFDDAENERILRRVAEKCYLPTNALLLRLIERHGQAFRCAFSISGCALDQFEAWAPEVLEQFRRLAASGCVEFLAETSQHSLAFLGDEEEFRIQVRAQARRIEELFGRTPLTFRNTELVLDNRVARLAEELGFQAVLGEGSDQLMGWRSPHRVYRPEGCQRLKVLLRSFRLSDDIAFRFSNRAWSEWPLTAERFASWVHGLGPEERVVGLFMDYETFGEHQWADTGIFDFLEALPEALLRNPRFRFATPTEAAAAEDPAGRLDIRRVLRRNRAGRRAQRRRDHACRQRQTQRSRCRRPKGCFHSSCWRSKTPTNRAGRSCAASMNSDWCTTSHSSWRCRLPRSAGA